MARGVSTVLDVAVCLLLIGAAVATLASAPPAATEDGPDADASARTVATATDGILFRDDTRHTTLAAHLSTAAVMAATLGDRRLLETTYPTAVGNATEHAVGHRTSVTATWAPYPNAPVRGRVAAGAPPPVDATVAATTLTVDTGLDRPTRSERRSFEALAGALAEAVVAFLFPPDRTRAALLDPRTEADTADRYRTVATALDADVDGAIDDADARAANEALTDALATRLDSDLRDHYNSPESATEATAVENVTLVIRRWEP